MKFIKGILFIKFFLNLIVCCAGTMGEAVDFPNWSGVYAGLNLGAMGHNFNVTDNQATTFYATIQEVANPGFTGGFQIGYRRGFNEFMDTGIYGFEFSMDFANNSFQQAYGSPYALYQLYAKNTLNSLGLLQFIGGIAANRTFIFLAAGLSWTNINANITNLTGVPYFNSFNQSKNMFGGALGGGIEYAFSRKFSSRIKIDFLPTNPYITYNSLGNSFQISNSSIVGTFGINYLFG